jgi:hypothetical protein
VVKACVVCDKKELMREATESLRTIFVRGREEGGHGSGFQSYLFFGASNQGALHCKIASNGRIAHT